MAGKAFLSVSVHFLPQLEMLRLGPATPGWLSRSSSAEGVALPPGCCPRVLAAVPMALPRAARAPGRARTHLWAQSSHSVPGLLLKSISALLQLPTAALCPCGRALQAALVAGSRALKTDIELLGVQVLFLFAFFFSQGLFRVWMCYCQSLKAGRPKKGWPLVGSR